MDVSGTVGDAWEIMGNIGGERGRPGSCAVRALPDVQQGHVWTSLARYYRRGPWWPLLFGSNNCGGLDDQFVIARGRRGLSAWHLCGPWWPLLLGGIDKGTITYLLKVDIVRYSGLESDECIVWESCCNIYGGLPCYYRFGPEYGRRPVQGGETRTKHER
jgi:hypothetical protein